MNKIIFDSAQQAVEKIAQEFKAYSEQGEPVHISLSGGSTPKLLFKILAQPPYNTEINWKNLHFWWGDERMVEPTDPESNYGEVQALLFDHIDIPTENIHRIQGEQEVQAELIRFEQEITDCVPNQEFDWIILGMGTDGHTASLFPNQTDFDDERLVIIAEHPETKQLRISKTAKLIEKAKRVTYLVTGQSKAVIIKQIFADDPKAQNYPAARIKASNGNTEWYLDKEAGELLG
ncbi:MULTISPECIES: 6-phosphogluconolactonase [Pasteurellaceae]|uniref:6-phosphogluconolactonase n=1 Tax=Pasteurella atlantica TaxID=2827233 RepID=A0AAW8CRF6_9PAST|nr:6-phosphogluconolactonase [Pasteurella atlantica]MBR0573973.1 6-phosphogluconolactonase [Pasteurella atlantica]MDP8039936.1 6-phosphogluconolactonase [Pasteurella atlantica]MDP8042012.1 6-phosphogluconolactonase [Pasteurella atlantica]MDP8044197.1 6-phosphogluconolactonase [Pasteurella atlantica]MDP8046238.1 6-phosphogluconolactonase [Pasteurella atlantica]